MNKGSESDGKPVIGISTGDLNGIGYEIILKALSDNRILEMMSPVVYGLTKAASYHKKAINLPDFSFNIIRRAENLHPRKANLVNLHDNEIRIDLGKPSQVSGEQALLSLETAVEDLKKGQIHALVTGPINKKTIQSDTFHFPGHTEYLTSKFNVQDSLMLMVSNNLRIGVVTGHIPVNEISKHLTQDLILQKIEILNNSLLVDFGIRSPRIAILALNPHAGDEGLLGSEEIDIIKPAIETAKEKGQLVFGPYPADGFFGSDSFMKFDGILAMYHDQGMLPFKTLSFDSGVNFTAGLPFIRTSPAHGTAYEIAGKDMASPDSFRAALYLACDIWNHRKEYAEISANPLKAARHEAEN
ncbi:MAG TPA: 4-hydroxythreonine-4-phosphate dehydrogenase PdxA [Lentimicrobium sp.]|nr:4-hydroxythreonine-4-phosphate dehydrogenase PdxA [Lentimicrobium sp.]